MWRVIWRRWPLESRRALSASAETTVSRAGYPLLGFRNSDAARISSAKSASGLTAGVVCCTGWQTASRPLAGPLAGSGWKISRTPVAGSRAGSGLRPASAWVAAFLRVSHARAQMPFDTPQPRSRLPPCGLPSPPIGQPLPTNRLLVRDRIPEVGEELAQVS